MRVVFSPGGDALGLVALIRDGRRLLARLAPPPPETLAASPADGSLTHL